MEVPSRMHLPHCTHKFTALRVFAAILPEGPLHVVAQFSVGQLGEEGVAVLFERGQ